MYFRNFRKFLPLLDIYLKRLIVSPMLVIQDITFIVPLNTIFVIDRDFPFINQERFLLVSLLNELSSILISILISQSWRANKTQNNCFFNSCFLVFKDRGLELPFLKLRCSFAFKCFLIWYTGIKIDSFFNANSNIFWSEATSCYLYKLRYSINDSWGWNQLPSSNFTVYIVSFYVCTKLPYNSLDCWGTYTKCLTNMTYPFTLILILTVDEQLLVVS